MFLSKVVLHPRCVAVHRLLSDLYRQHQFVLSAFPGRRSERTDRESGQLGSKPCVLYRFETTDKGSRFFLLAQSEEEPDWERGIDLHPGVILTSCTKEINLEFAEGQVLRFRLRANPTMMHVNGDITIKANHKRAGLYTEKEQLDWLERHAERNGFQVIREAILLTSHGVLIGEKPSVKEGEKGHTVKCLSVDFDGTLIVTNPDVFLSAIRNGIGRGKAWGCGLLSVAPVLA